MKKTPQVQDQKAVANAAVTSGFAVSGKGRLEQARKTLKNEKVQKFMRESFMPAMRRLANE